MFSQVLSLCVEGKGDRAFYENSTLGIPNPFNLSRSMHAGNGLFSFRRWGGRITILTSSGRITILTIIPDMAKGQKGIFGGQKGQRGPGKTSGKTAIIPMMSSRIEKTMAPILIQRGLVRLRTKTPIQIKGNKCVNTITGFFGITACIIKVA